MGKSTFGNPSTSEIFMSVLYSGHIPLEPYEVMLSIYSCWCVELRDGSGSPGLLLLFRVPISNTGKQRCAGLQSERCAKAKISWCDSSASSSNWTPCFFLCAHPIWARRAPAARWQLTIASLPLINCWNDTPSHKQCILLQASKTLRCAIVRAKYASTFSLGLSLKAGWERSGLLGVLGMRGGGLCLACKFQSRLRYPSGALADSQNQFGEGVLASTFLCFSFHLSLPFSHSPSSLHSLSLSSCFLLFIHLPLTLLSHARFHLLFGCLFYRSHLSNIHRVSLSLSASVIKP